MTSTVMYCHKT